MPLIVLTPITTPPPPPPPPPPGSPDQSFQVTLIGGDGSVWDLSDGAVGLLTGPSLFAPAPVTHWWGTSPLVDGSSWVGMRTDARSVTLPVVVETDDWTTWRSTDAALFQALHPSRECQLQVTAPDGVTRWMGLRYVAGGEIDDGDPLLWTSASYVLEFTAAIPFWRGSTIIAPLDPTDPVPLFPGPPFHINAKTYSTGGTITNPGDEPAWPRYTIQGPADSWSIKVGSASISSNTPLAAGQAVYIDTDRTQLTVVDESGVNVYGNLDSDTFAAIPAGTDVKLQVSIGGYNAVSQVTVEFTPLYRRPW